MKQLLKTDVTHVCSRFTLSVMETASVMKPLNRIPGDLLMYHEVYKAIANSKVARDTGMKMCEVLIHFGGGHDSKKSDNCPDCKVVDISLTDIDHDPLHFAMTALSPKGKQSMWNKFGNGSVEAIVPLESLDQVKSVLAAEGLEVENFVATSRVLDTEYSDCVEFRVGERYFLFTEFGLSVAVDRLVETVEDREFILTTSESFSSFGGFKFDFRIRVGSSL